MTKQIQLYSRWTFLGLVTDGGKGQKVPLALKSVTLTANSFREGGGGRFLPIHPE